MHRQPPSPRRRTTAPSTRRLSELARHIVVPTGAVSTGWPEVKAFCEAAGDKFDRWQDGLGQAILAKRADDIYAATIGGIVLSIPRQVAKTWLVSRIIFAICSLYPNTKVIWTAHRTRTSTNTFKNLKGFIARPGIRQHILGQPRETNGEQEIRFKNGSVIMFGAREAGFGLGFDAIDIAVFDECQRLTEKGVDDIVPTTNQSGHPHGALIFYMGTPPRRTDAGEIFRNKRNRVLAEGDKNTLYCEFSADQNADSDDQEQWKKANPSFPHRTPLESMLRMRENLGSDESWRREALGIWDVDSDETIIDLDRWNAPVTDGGLYDEDSFAVKELAFGIDISPRGTSATVAVAGQREDGLWHVELAESRQGTAWVVPYVAEKAKKNKLRCIVVDSHSGASTFAGEFAQHHIRITVTDLRQMAAAVRQFQEHVEYGDVFHIGQHQLSLAISETKLRSVLDGANAYSRKLSESDITPTVAVTLALWGSTAPQKEVTRPRYYAAEESSDSNEFIVLA